MNSSNTYSLSIVLAVYNEADQLPRCLKAIATIADQIVVVDGESTDETVRVAHDFKAKVISTSNKPLFHINKQIAIDAATSDWILQLDADEVVDEDMHAALIRLKAGEFQHFDGYFLKRRNYFLGTFLTKGGQYPDPVIRLFKRGKGKLPQKDVHEQIEIDGEIGWFDGHLLHYNAPSFSRYIINANRYTSLTAEQLKEARTPLTIWNDIRYLLIRPLTTFGSLYFRHRGYVDGFPGLVFALFSGIHHALAYMKLGDLYRKANT